MAYTWVETIGKLESTNLSTITFDIETLDSSLSGTWGPWTFQKGRFRNYKGISKLKTKKQNLNFLKNLVKRCVFICKEICFHYKKKEERVQKNTVGATWLSMHLYISRENNKSIFDSCNLHTDWDKERKLEIKGKG